jgi:hypothetical protein
MFRSNINPLAEVKYLTIILREIAQDNDPKNTDGIVHKKI